MYESGIELLFGRALMAALIAKYGAAGPFPTDAAIIAKLVTLLEANLP
jgi:hypothetical protein